MQNAKRASSHLKRHGVITHHYPLGGIHKGRLQKFALCRPPPPRPGVSEFADPPPPGRPQFFFKFFNLHQKFFITFYIEQFYDKSSE